METTLFKHAIELGAQPLNDLTDKVTHLLAVEPGSAKYKASCNARPLIVSELVEAVCAGASYPRHAPFLDNG